MLAKERWSLIFTEHQRIVLILLKQGLAFVIQTIMEGTAGKKTIMVEKNSSSVALRTPAGF